MKKFLSFLCLLFFVHLAKAQITTSVLKANFGIEGDLKSNYFNLTPFPGEDDWFNNGDAGLGEFVIDTTGAAAIVAGYTTVLSTTTSSLTRGMRQTIYSVVNNKLLMDANFTRDYHGNDSTVFASGSNKNGMSAALWNPSIQSIPNKNDILDAFTHVRRDGPNPSDSLWMFGGLSIENTTGNRYFDFELFQTNFSYNANSQTFSGYGPDAGHRSWVFDAAGNIVTPGDIIFTAEFSSSGLTLIEARIWINSASLSIVPNAFSWGGAFNGDGAGAVFGYANILPKTAGAFYTGIQNSAPTWAGPFALLRGNNAVVTNYIAGQFMEFSVNLTKLGIDPGSYGNACGAPFKSVLIKSRASTSFTSELKDFVAPFQLFNYSNVRATSMITYFCGKMPPTIIHVVNPVSTSTYTWSTTDGNIISPAENDSVTVNAPGTYYVTQKLNAACAPLSKDSLRILFDSSCLILNTGITKFTVTNNNGYAVIAWQASNNELALKYVVEYSNYDLVFHEMAYLPAIQKTGMAEYVFSEPTQSLGKVFYRIKIIQKNNAIKYSNTISVNSEKATKKNTLIFPNPVQGEAFLSIESSGKTMVTIYLSDMTGRLISTLKLPVKQGDNLLSLHELTRQTGMYLVRVKSIDGETTQQLVIKK
jgi:hypothetical protein